MRVASILNFAYHGTLETPNRAFPGAPLTAPPLSYLQVTVCDVPTLCQGNQSRPFAPQGIGESGDVQTTLASSD